MPPISTKGLRRLKRSRQPSWLQRGLRLNRSAIRQLRFEQFEPRQLLAADLHAALIEPAQELASKPEQGMIQELDHLEDWRTHFDLFTPQGTQLVQYGGYLSDASAQAPLAIVSEFLASSSNEFGLSSSDLQDYIVTDLYTSEHTGMTHVYLQQRYLGLPVAGANININVTDDGRVLSAGSSFVSLDSASANSRELRASASALDHGAPNPFNDESHWSGIGAFALTADDALLSLAEQFGWELGEQPQVVSEELGPANRGHKQFWTAGDLSLDEIPAELQYVPQPYGLELAWRLTVRRPDGQHWIDAHVSTLTGDVLNVADWVSHASYNVFALPKESPSDGPRTVEVDPHDTTASPFGWHDTNGAAGAEFTTTQGNNVWAFADRDGDNVADLGSSPSGGPSLTFNSALNLTQQPISYRDASVTNLFYLSNALHDIHYQYGFNAPAGNFQENNYGQGGVGGDAVLAEAQDQADGGPEGPQRDNALFASPPEGTPGRMQIFLFSQTSPERDAALDNGLVIHEYSHGVSSRLTGGPANAGSLGTLQSAGLAEGWSDWYTLMLTQIANDTAGDARGVGTYLLGEPSTGAGVRTQPYSYNMSVNDLTFGDIEGVLSTHFIGEVWAATLWDLNWALIQGSALDPNLPNTGLGFDPDFYAGVGGNNLSLQLVMDGMKLQRTTPTLLEARDAILAADVALTGGANQLAIWTVFARRGMGYSADDGGTSDATAVTEAFDLPSTPDGVVVFDEAAVLEGDLLSVRLRDSDLSGNQTLQVTSASGDSENIVLTREGPFGIFVGTLDTGAGAVAADGVLQVNAGDTVTVTYIDADDGMGGVGTLNFATASIETRLANALLPGSPGGSLISISENLSTLRSASDIEPFTFFAEAGELIGATARPFGNETLDLQIVGLTSSFQSPEMGAPAAIPPIEIPATGMYQLFVGGSGPVLAEVILARNVVLEQAIGDSADENELLINPAGISLGGGTRYAVSAQSVPIGAGIVNGSFETGDFSGWDVIAIGNAFVPWTVSGAGAGSGYGLASTQPQTGDFVAWNGFEGAGPMQYVMTQNVLLPNVPVTLAWKDRIQWDFGFVAGIATEGRTFEVQIRDPDDQTILATLHSFDTQPEFIAATGDTGWQSHTVDLSAFSGQFVQLAFVEHIEQQWTGPAQLEIDDVELVGMPAPAPDIDEFLIDLRGKAGKQVDILLASQQAVLSSATLELLGTDGTTILATASSYPLGPSSPVRNFLSGISGFTIPADGVYTLRVTASEFGGYQVLVTESLIFDTESADDLQPEFWRSLDEAGGAMGYVNGVSAYEVVEVPFDYVELPLLDSFYVFLDDDQVSAARDIEFDFDFFDQTHDSLYVSSNGFITFLPNQYHGCCIGPSVPNPDDPNAVIAGWWRDLVPNVQVDPPAFIRHKTLGTVGNRVFHLEFNRIPHFSDWSLRVTMEIKLFEATGDIEVHYVKAPADGRDHTAGIENHGGTEGIEYYHGVDSLPDNSAIRYQRASAVDRYTLMLQAGQEVTLQTQTPFDAAGQAVPNTLDPELRVIHPNGFSVIGSDQNSLDGKNARLTFVAPAAGVYTVEVVATAGVGAYALEKFQPDLKGPRVTDVILGSTAWSESFIDVVDGGGSNSGNGLGLSLVGPSQLDNVPWINIDKIYFQFDEDVSQDFNADNLHLSGINISDYMMNATLTYGVGGQNVGTVTLATPIANDIVLINLSDSLTDASGNALNGEWTDGVSLLSGDSSSGGSFNFRMDALPGDVNNSDGVNLVDVFAALAQSGNLTDFALRRADVNGSGGVNLVDVFAILGRNGTVLPSLPSGGEALPWGVLPVGSFVQSGQENSMWIEKNVNRGRVSGQATRPPGFSAGKQAAATERLTERATYFISTDLDYTEDLDSTGRGGNESLPNSFAEELYDEPE